MLNRKNLETVKAVAVVGAVEGIGAIAGSSIGIVTFGGAISGVLQVPHE